MSLQTALQELYLVDQQVRGLESRADGARRQVQVQQAKIAQLQQQIKELNDQLKAAQAAEANHENEANTVEARITKLRDQMNSAKTNKEYSAFLVEVNTLKAEKSKFEDKALEIMGNIDKLKAQIQQVTEKIAEQEKIKKVADADLAARTAEVADRLVQTKAKRVEAAAKVPADALKVFDQLLHSMDGEALAPVHQEDKRVMEFTCGGCFIVIPAERVNKLYRHPDELVHCPNCSRILYLESDMKQAINR